MSFKSTKNQIVFPVIFAVCTGVFFFDTLFFGKVFAFRDFYRYFYPYKNFASEWLRSGVFPLWNPLSSCGAPFYAGLQSQVAYPLSFIHYFLPFNFGLHLFVAVHFFLAGLFLYLLCLDLKMKNFAACLGGIIFAFSGYLLSTVDLLTTLSSVIWVPLIVLVYLRALKLERVSILIKLFHIVIVSLLLGIQFLGGEPTVLYGTGLLLLLLTAVFYEKKSSWLFLAAVTALTLLFVSFQLLPFLEYLKYSDRGAQNEPLTKQLNMLWSLPPEQLLNLVIPWYAGDITKINVNWYGTEQMWLKSVYAGFIPVVLFISGIFYLKKESGVRRRLFISFYLGVVLFGILALGKYGVFYDQLFNYLPGYGSIRFPVKFVFVVIFLISVLAAYAFDSLLTRYPGRLKNTKSTGPQLLLPGVLILAAVLIVYFKKPSGESWTGYLFESILIFSAALTLLFFYLNKRLSRKMFTVLILLLVFSDLFMNNYFINPRLPAKIYSENLAIASYLKTNQQSSRTLLYLKPGQEVYIYGESYDAAMEKALLTVYPNQNMTAGLYYVNGYDSLNPKVFTANYAELRNTPRVRTLDLMSVKYIVTREDFNTKLLKKKKDYDGLKIYENIGFLPRCYFSASLKPFGDDPAAHKYLTGNEFNPHLETVVIKPGLFWDGKIIKSGKNTVLMQEEGPNKIRVRAELVNSGAVVLTDTFFPGWQAYIDGKNTEILLANGLFRSILSPPGKHEIVFKYEPLSLRLGVAITTITILVVFLVLILLYNSFLYGRKPDFGNRKRHKAALK